MLAETYPIHGPYFIYRMQSEHVGAALSHFRFCLLHLEHDVWAGPEVARAPIFSCADGLWFGILQQQGYFWLRRACLTQEDDLT